MDWKKLVGTVAPWIGTALGGPLGGMAVDAVANALGLSDKTVDAVKQAVSGATPEQMLAIKQADQAFAVKMQELGFENQKMIAQLAVDNTKDARDMQKVTGSWVPGVLAVVVTIGFFGILIGMMSGELTVDDNQALLIMLGALGAAWGAVVNFYYGSSAGSRENQTALRTAVKKE